MKSQYSSEEARGIACVKRWRKNPEMLSQLLGNFYDTSPRGVFLRRLLLAMNIPPHWLGIVGRLSVSSIAKEKWFEFLERYSFWKGVRRGVGNHETWQKLTHGVPILMYHAFAEAGENASRYVLPIRKFRTQMWLLNHLGYQIITLDEYLKCLNTYHLPPKKSVIITIDDGYKDNYSLAYPVLKDFGIPASIFLVSDHLGATNDWDENSVLTARPLFDKCQAKEIQNGIIAFGAHSCTHPWLSKASEQKIREEVHNSKVNLERELGSAIRSFSYPHGDYDDRVIAIVKEAGFAGACTTNTGLNTFQTSIFALRRTEIRGNFSLWRFLRAVYSGA